MIRKIKKNLKKARIDYASAVEINSCHNNAFFIIGVVNYLLKARTYIF